MVEDISEPCVTVISHNNLSETHSTKANENKYFQTERQDLQKNLNLTINLWENYKLDIYKPLLPLKFILFLWYGGAAFSLPFVSVYFKQRGVSLGEMTIAFTVSPIAQFFGTLLSGIISDKIGKSKPVLIANLILTMIFLIIIMLIPRLDVIKHDYQIVNISCYTKQCERVVATQSCGMISDTIRLNSCNLQYPEDATENDTRKNFMPYNLKNHTKLKNLTLFVNVNDTFLANDLCYYNISYMTKENGTYFLCDMINKKNCNYSCLAEIDEDSSDRESFRNILMILAMILYICFMVTHSNCYRAMDVTCMFLVKEHNSSFGRERFFAIAGVLVLSPTAGYLINVTSPNGGEKNINIAFYLFFAIILVILLMIYKLEVRINAPGQKMVKKTARFLKNPDVISFALIVLALGTAFTFWRNFIFWYMEEMKASGMLLGLIPAANALYGLPFLFTSKWWVDKIGPKYIFILGLLGYVVNCTSYSFLNNPWFSLILEATSILTYHLLWVAVVIHSHELAPEGLTASVISIAGSIHYQLGKMLGSAVGGTVMDTFGGPVAFRVVAAICLTCATCYGIYLFMRHKYFNGNLKNIKIEVKEEKVNEPEVMDKF